MTDPWPGTPDGTIPSLSLVNQPPDPDPWLTDEPAPHDDPGDGTDGDAWHAEWQLPNPTIDQFLAEPEPEYDWLIPGLIERQDRIIVTAAEGIGKSTLIRQFCVQAAAGIHPFTRDEISPIRVVLLDLENSRRHVRRQLRALRISAGRRLLDGQLIISVVPEGIDLMHEQGLMALDDLLARSTPDLVGVGPLYKLASGDPKDEEQAQAVRKALDHYRVTYNCAFIIEAHQPYATGGSTKRPLRPYGASLWSRWPEFGVALTGLPGAPAAELQHWRGARDERDWPASLQRGGEWPWSPAVGKDHTFARLLAEASAYAEQHGKFPSIRALSTAMAGVQGASKTSIGNLIQTNRKQWEALKADLGLIEEDA